MVRRPNPQTLRRLTYFAAVADAGSIREAARRLGLSVASVSEALAALEEELGVTLANRNTRSLQLTQEGRRVEQVAHRILDAAEDLFVGQDDPSDLTGHVALTVPVEIAQSWLPARLDVLWTRSPGIEVSISASDAVVDLSQSAFDLAIRARFVPPEVVVDDPSVLPLTCVSAKPLALEPRDYGWFAPVTLLSQMRRDDLDVVDRRSGEVRSIRFANCLEVDNKHVALAMVDLGMGAALVTRYAVSAESSLNTCQPYLEFGCLQLSVEMRDKRPSQAALAVKAALSEGRIN